LLFRLLAPFFRQQGLALFLFPLFRQSRFLPQIQERRILWHRRADLG
jgi:hypothetical protein